MEILRMAEEWLQEPTPDNGTVGELDVDEITVMIAGLVDKVKFLTALCDGYRGEVTELRQSITTANARWEATEREFYLKMDAAESALTRARAEGMDEAAKIVDAECERILATQTGKQDDFNRAVDQQVRMVAVMLPEVAEAIRAKAKE